jgi:HEAT repeat protein
MVCRHYLKYSVCTDNCTQTRTCILFLQHRNATPDINQLINILRTHEDPGERNDAALLLGRSRNIEVADILLQQLEIEENTEVKSHIVFALGMLREVRAMSKLITLLNEPEPMIREYAAIALGNIGERSAAEDLIKALKNDPETFVRGYAAIALGKLGGSKAMKALICAMHEDPEPEVRRLAEKAAGLKKTSIFMEN